MKKTLCIADNQMCNGVRECPKGLDEASATCKNYNCQATTRVCLSVADYSNTDRLYCTLSMLQWTRQNMRAVVVCLPSLSFLQLGVHSFR